MNLTTIKNIKKIRSKIKRKVSTIGGWMQISNSNIAEMISDNDKYDWVVLDFEHGVFSIETLPDLIRAIELNNKLPLVRLPNKNLDVSAQVLDAGCGGVIIPNVNNANELQKIVQKCYLPPYGKRGVGFSRANLFGKKFKQKINIKPLIVPMIENIKAVKNLEKILSVKGVDAILIGPYDLSASMKITGKFNSSKFKKIITKIKDISKKFKISCGIHVMSPDLKVLKNYEKKGFKFLPYCTDALLLNSSIKNAFK